MTYRNDTISRSLFRMTWMSAIRSPISTTSSARPSPHALSYIGRTIVSIPGEASQRFFPIDCDKWMGSRSSQSTIVHSRSRVYQLGLSTAAAFNVLPPLEDDVVVRSMNLTTERESRNAQNRYFRIGNRRTSRLYRFGMSASISVSGARPSAVSPSDLFNQISAGVSLVNGQTINMIGAETLRITRKHAGLAIVLGCILLFPIGLLFLLARQTETISITATESDGAVIASAAGTGDPEVVSFLHDLLGG